MNQVIIETDERKWLERQRVRKAGKARRGPCLKFVFRVRIGHKKKFIFSENDYHSRATKMYAS